MNRRDFLSTSSKAACACALGAGSLLITHCSSPSDSYVPADSSGIELDFDLTRDFSYSNIYGHAMFSVSNLLDTVGRDHLEAKKGQVQLPGRSFNFLLRFYY